MIKRYLSVAPETPVLSGRINSISQDPESLGIHSLGYLSLGGSHLNVRPGMVIKVGSHPGLDDLGRMFVRKSPTSSQLFVNESSHNKPRIKIWDYFTVIDVFAPRTRMPRIVGRRTGNSSFYDDFESFHDYDIRYIDQNTKIQPQANITSTGSKPVVYAGFIDHGEDFRTVMLSASTSVVMSAQASSYSVAWDVKDGTIVSGGVSSPNIVVRFPRSKLFRNISLKVTDNMGASHTRYCPIWVHSPENYPIVKFEIHSDSRSQWREMEFELFAEEADRRIPERSQFCYWETDFEDHPKRVGQFLGWTPQQSETLKHGDRTTLRFPVYGIGWWLNLYRGFEQTLLSANSPAHWYEFSNLTINRAVHYVLREYTNAIDIGNFYPSAIAHRVEDEDIINGTVWAQIQQLALGNEYCVIRADSSGAIRIIQSRSYAVNRANLSYDMELTPSCWEDGDGLSITQSNVEKASLIRATGSYFDGDNSHPLASVAPSETPGYATTQDTAPFQRLPSVGPQIRLNVLTGHHFAKLNNPYEAIAIKLIEDLDIFEPLQSTVRVRSNQYDLICEVDTVSVSHSFEMGQMKQVTITLSFVTYGHPAVTEIIEVREEPNPILNPDPIIGYDPRPIAPILPPTAPGEEDPEAFDVLLVTTKGISKTTTFLRPESQGGPEWVFSAFQEKLGGTPIQFITDPFNESTLAGLLLTTSRLYYVEDIHKTPTFTAIVNFRAVSHIRNMSVSYDQPYVGVVSAYPDGVYFTYSYNLSTWEDEKKIGTENPCMSWGSNAIVDDFTFRVDSADYARGDTYTDPTKVYRVEIEGDVHALSSFVFKEGEIAPNPWHNSYAGGGYFYSSQDYITWHLPRPVPIYRVRFDWQTIWWPAGSLWQNLNVRINNQIIHTRSYSNRGMVSIPTITELFSDRVVFERLSGGNWIKMNSHRVDYVDYNSPNRADAQHYTTNGWSNTTRRNNIEFEGRGAIAADETEFSPLRNTYSFTFQGDGNPVGVRFSSPPSLSSPGGFLRVRVHEVYVEPDCGDNKVIAVSAPGLYVSSRSPRIYTTAPVTLTHADGYQSSDFGDTFFRLGWPEPITEEEAEDPEPDENGGAPPKTPNISPGKFLAGDIHVPFTSPDNEFRVYYGGYDHERDDITLRRVSDDGETFEIIAPVIDDEGYGPVKSDAIKSLHQNGDFIVFVLMNKNRTKSGVWVTDNAGQTLGMISEPETGTEDGRFESVFINQNTGNLYLVGTKGRIAVSFNMGSTLLNKKGNIDSLDVGTIIGVIAK